MLAASRPLAGLDALVASLQAAFSACIGAAVAHLRGRRPSDTPESHPGSAATAWGRRPSEGYSTAPSPQELDRSSAAGSESGESGPLAPRQANAESSGDDAVMAEAFPRLRRRLELVRLHNRHCAFGAVRAEATATAGDAAAVGLMRLAAGAAAAGESAARGEFLRSEAVEQLDILLDSAEALWSTGRCRV